MRAARDDGNLRSSFEETMRMILIDDQLHLDQLQNHAPVD